MFLPSDIAILSQFMFWLNWNNSSNICYPLLMVPMDRNMAIAKITGVYQPKVPIKVNKKYICFCTSHKMVKHDYKTTISAYNLRNIRMFIVEKMLGNWQ